jgi:hypothetical protein
MTTIFAAYRGDPPSNARNKLVKRRHFAHAMHADNAYCTGTWLARYDRSGRTSYWKIVRRVFVDPVLARVCLIKIMQV